MSRAAGASVVLFLALAAGCASAPPEELQDIHSAKQDERIDAALALSKKLAAREPEYVKSKDQISVELRRLLDDRSALVRQVAIDALVDVEGKAAAGPIADRLRDKDAWVRYAAVKRLGDLGAQTAAEPIAELLRKDESADVRSAAAEALAKLRPTAAIRDLYLALQDDARSVRYHAYVALVAITGKDLGEDPKAWRAVIPRGAGE
jgi:HEAT repeat protein